MSAMKELEMDFYAWWDKEFRSFVGEEDCAKAAFIAGAALHAREARWLAWIQNHSYGSGDGLGSTYWFYVGVDHEDLGCAIQQAIDSGIPHHTKEHRARTIEHLCKFYNLQPKP